MKQRFKDTEISPPGQEIGSSFDGHFDEDVKTGLASVSHDVNNNSINDHDSNTTNAITCPSVCRSINTFYPPNQTPNHTNDVPSVQDGIINLNFTPANSKQCKSNHDSFRPPETDFEKRPQHYRYPVFAEGVDAFSDARADPTACNINNDMVLLWKDVVICADDYANEQHPKGKSLRELTIDDVFNNLHRVAEQHRQLRTQREQAYPKKALDLPSPGSQAGRRKSQKTKDGFSSHYRPNTLSLSDENDSPGGFNFIRGTSPEIGSVYYLNDNSNACLSNVRSNANDLVDSNMRLPSNPGGRPSPRPGSESNPQSHSKDCALHKDQNYHHSQHHLQQQQQQQECPILSTRGCFAEHYHEHYTDFTHDPPVTYLLPCGAPCPCPCPTNGFVISTGECQCCRCYCQMESMYHHKPYFCDFDGARKASQYYCHCHPHCSPRYQLNPDLLHIHSGNTTVPQPPTTDNRQHKDNRSRSIFVCGNLQCPKMAKFHSASCGKSYKSCHHCRSTYCCSACREFDWFRHKTYFCYGSLVSSTCKEIVQFCREDERTQCVLSRLARRSYLSQGRGCLLVGFSGLASAREFLEEGTSSLELRPTYVSLKELTKSKMHGEVLESLIAMCQRYNPEVKYVLNIGIGLYPDWKSVTNECKFHHHCPNSKYCPRCHFRSTDTHPWLSGHHENVEDIGSHPWILSRHRAPILQKTIKLRLHKDSIPLHEHHMTFEKHWWDEYRTSGPTLILTGIPGIHSEKTSRKSRELCLANIQRKLRHRGVNLRQQFPDVYNALISYVSDGTHFPSQVLFPVDTRSRKIFTCFLMPEAEAELEWMQSHFLLDDLELSKDSINKSMSESDSRSFL